MSSSDSDYSDTGTSESCSDVCGSIETAESESNEEFLYDEDLEPVATEEERNAYEEQVAAEEAKNLELQRRFRGETNVHSWLEQPIDCSGISLSVLLGVMDIESTLSITWSPVDEFGASSTNSLPGLGILLSSSYTEDDPSISRASLPYWFSVGLSLLILVACLINPFSFSIVWRACREKPAYML